MKKSNDKKNINARNILFAVMSIIVFSLMLYRSDIAIEYMKKGLKLCTASIIPSLFPFMIISELIIKNPIIYNVIKRLRRPMNMLFGLSEAGCCAFMLGALCGFPIGAKAAVSSYDSGFLSQEELARLLCFCNNPSSAFVISVVGMALLGNKKIGIIMYICILLSSIIVGIILNLFSGKKQDISNTHSHSYISGVDMVTVFTSSVSSSATTMLVICAYVVFFSAFIGCINDILLSVSAPQLLTAIIFGFFEMSGGVSAAACSQNVATAAILCAAFSAWSGISVHCQIITICSGRGLSYKKYFISKAAQGIVCAFLMGVWIKFLFPNVLPVTEDVFVAYGDAFMAVNSVFACISFFLASILGVVYGIKSNKKKDFDSIDKKVKKI